MLAKNDLSQEAGSPLQASLEAWVQRQAAPLAIEIDARWSVQAIVGDPAQFGWPQLTLGSDLRRVLPRLPLPAQPEPFEIPQLDIGSRVVRARLEPTATGLRLLLMNSIGSPAEVLELARDQEIARMDRRVSELLIDLRHARTRAEELDVELERVRNARSRFLAALSHEFRTPLTSVLGHARRSGTRDPAFRAIERAGEHLLALVNNLIDQAALERGKLQSRAHNANTREIFEDLLSLFAPLAEQRRLRLSAQIDGLPEQIHVDVTRVRQILINVLGNAIKYTEQGSVRVYASWHDDRLLVRVRDSGPGIDSGTRDRLFEAFERPAESSQTGTGLGLAISRGLARHMGGDLTLDSTPGLGTEVRIELAAPLGAAATGQTGRISRESQRVLICDDDPDIRELMRTVIEDAGYVVDDCGSAEDLLLAMQTVSPQMVVIDANLPGASGLRTASRLRAAGWSGRLLLVTADATAQMASAALLAGCDDCLAKPLSPEQLVETLDRWLLDAPLDV